MKKIAREKEQGRKKSLRMLSAMLCLCLLITACPYMPGEISVQAAESGQPSENNRVMLATAAHSHCVCGGSVTTGGHSHESGVVWEEWPSTSLPTSGNYYLTKDITVPRFSEWKISADIKLCLNGHTLTCTGTKYNSVTINSGGSLSICDCKNTGSLNLVNNYAGGGQSACGVYISGGTFSLYSGAITVQSDVQNNDKGFIGLWNSGKTYLYGGSIIVTAEQQQVTAIVDALGGYIYGGTYTARGKESGTDYALNVRKTTYLVGSPSFSPARVLLSEGKITESTRIMVKEGFPGLYGRFA